MKELFKNNLTKLLGWQLKRLQKHNKFNVIAVVGSSGRTSAKFAIASALQSSRLIKWQKSNYDTPLSVPLVFFGHKMPHKYNIFAWLSILLQNEFTLTREYVNSDVIVELGAYAPGQMMKFKEILNIDVAVITGVSSDFMESFSSVDQLAKEELSVSKFAKKLIINADLIDEKYYQGIKKPIETFGQRRADVIIKMDMQVQLNRGGKKWLTVGSAYSLNEAYAKTAAALTESSINLSSKQIVDSIVGFESSPGRMQLLEGANGSIIIDDTHNATADSVIATLYMLYQRNAKHRIAMLGNMSELGAASENAHKIVGKYCNPNYLDLLITVGPDANQYLAPAAEAKGCKVKSFENPQEAGEYVKKHLKAKSVILAKGSQNSIFMEEAVKVLLAHDEDSSRLIRQDSDWLKKKQQSFAT